LKATPASLPVSLLTSILLILILFSCKKDPYEIGIDLLPPSDTLHVLSTDTCTVVAFSVGQDSIRTDEATSLALGSMMDPVFGKTTASFYTQLRLSSDGADFGKNPVLDSLVLCLYYNGYYGDTSTQQNIKVYEISQDLEIDSGYYSNQSATTYQNLLANLNFVPHPTDSVSVYGKKVRAHLRVNLSKYSSYFGNKLLYAPESVLANSASFIQFMKGLYLEASAVNFNGSLLNFTTSDGSSRMTAYFHDGNDPANDSLTYDFLLNDQCARFTHIDHHGYLDASPDLKRQILSHDSAQGSNQLFLQGLAGVRIKVKFPYLKTFGKGSVIAVNDAVLMFKNPDPDTTLSPPPALNLVRQDSIGRIAFIKDENEGSSYFGGTYDKTTRTYFFRITQHIQKVLLGSYTNSFDLYILVNNPTKKELIPDRVMLNGTRPQIPVADEERFRLKLTYTKL